MTTIKTLYGIIFILILAVGGRGGGSDRAQQKEQP